MSKNKASFKKGFTLIELLVVISIVMIVSIISAVYFSKSKKGLNLRSTVEEVALNLRKSQSLALAVKSSGGFIPTYQNGYGIHFERGSLSGAQDASDYSYIVFTDYETNPGPGGWDRAYLKNVNSNSACGTPQQSVSECLEKIPINAGDKITDLALCSIVNGSPTCSSVSAGGYLDIVFLRPNLDAYFCTTAPSGGGCAGATPTVGYGKITLTSVNNTSKTINIWSTGQIEIK